MKKVLFLVFLIATSLVFSCCCSSLTPVICPVIGQETGLCDINNFEIPDDPEFMVTIKSLSQPWLIGWYMEQNFKYNLSCCAKSPYLLWRIKRGDCNDFSTFAAFVAHYHNIPAWQIRIKYLNRNIAHWLCVFEEKYKDEIFYSYTSNQRFSNCIYKNIEILVNHYCEMHEREWISFQIYDYRMNLIKEIINNEDLDLKIEILEDDE